MSQRSRSNLPIGEPDAANSYVRFDKRSRETECSPCCGVVAGAELFTGNNLIAMAWASTLIGTREVLRSCPLTARRIRIWIG